MKYPVVQANSNGLAMTSVFLGINRLPEGKDGEGTEFKNLSLDLYPAVSTAGLSETGETLYIKDSDGADTAVDLNKIQAIGDVYEKDGVMYLTGVYNGEFYYRGKVSDYYRISDDKKIKTTDTVTIEKIGKTYVIFAKNESGKSFVYSYNTEPAGTTQPELRKIQNVLTSEVIKYRLPTESFRQLYIYKMAIDNYDGEYGQNKLQQLQWNTGKQYYFVYMYQIYYSGRFYPKNLKEVEMYDSYDGLSGMGMTLSSDVDDFDDEYYCFNDGDTEHPVKFVIDAASKEGDVISKLIEREKAAYSGEKWNWPDNLKEHYPTPYGISVSSSGKHSQYERILLLLGEEDGEGYYAADNTIQTGGIIGHFEKWDENTNRYEYYVSGEDNAIWRRCEFVDGVKQELKWWDNNRPLGSELRPVMDHYHNDTNTLIPINPTGVETDGIRLSNMTAYKGRIFATVNDGSMLVASELGSYTDFGEFQGISTDSGYFNSLTSGKYTGISEYQGTLVVFKADRISIYYGDTPSDMMLSHEIKNVGCIDSESIKEVNGVLIFLGKDGFYAYSGGQPQHISRKLNKVYKSARAFVSGRKYYAATENELLIYDTDTGAWTSSDPIDIKGISGERLFLSDGRVMKVLNNEEWSGNWVYESMDMFEDMNDDKGINEIYIRAKLNGSLTVKTITDEAEREHMTFEDEGEKVKVWRVPVKFLHGNYYRIRLEGKGKCILYAVERKCYAGGRQR